MGIWISKLFDWVSPGQECRCAMLGLDAAGKSTLLFKMKLGEVVHTIPTIGFNVETVEFKSLKFNVFDVGGQDRLRPLWKYYYEGVKAVLWVIDSTDLNRMDESRQELHKLLAEDELRDAALLVFANKQDLPTAHSVAEISERLQLSLLRSRNWYISACSAVSGDGIYEGMDWLATQMREQSRHNRQRA